MKDVIIIGGGPAGLAAAIYTCRFNLKTLVIEDNAFGGQLSKIHRIDNYPGNPQIDGATLANNLLEQAKSFGLETKSGHVSKIIDGDLKQVYIDGEVLECRALIIATGTSITRLDIKYAKEFTGKGISYCATCDGFFYRKKDVVVLGQKSEALKEALFLSSLANKVYIVGERNSLLAEENVLNKINETNNIEIIYGAKAKELIIEDNKLSGLVLSNNQKIACSGIFPYVGSKPNTDFLEADFLDDQAYIVVDNKMATSHSGIYAAGDVIAKTFRQVITACNDGAIAANSLNTYLKHK